MEYMDVIRNRRSIRKFKNTPVPEQVIEDLLESARLAPSGGNSQYWLFGVITDKDIIRRLPAIAGNQEWIATAPLVIAVCADVTWKIGEQPAIDHGLRINRDRFTPELVRYLREYPDQRAVSLLMENGTVMIPGEHICLTAVHHGLGACWIGDLDTKKVSDILGLPDDYACAFLIPVGYPDTKPAGIGRKELSEITFYNRYGGDSH